MVAKAQPKGTGSTSAVGSKTTEPLWWINPNNYIYSELNDPQHSKNSQKPIKDTDGDGIPDQFDLDPNTPKGVNVNSRGVPVDTDGDGVPDFKDKELLTPTKCFPVNADGVGKCPESGCCTDVQKRIKELEDKINELSSSGGSGLNNCKVGPLPSIQFKGGARLTKEAEIILGSAASQLKANPNCKVKVIGYGATSKAAQQLSYDKVSAVIKHLVEKQGIAEKRIIFVYGQEGDVNTVDLQPTTENGPNNVPAPHPNLRTR